MDIFSTGSFLLGAVSVKTSRFPANNRDLASKLLSNDRPSLMIMKKHARRDHTNQTPRQVTGEPPSSEGSVGRWAFNLASESLFAVGDTDQTRRLAYRTVSGEIRFLPL